MAGTGKPYENRFKQRISASLRQVAPVMIGGLLAVNLATALPQTAQAADKTPGNVTITQTQENQNVRYQAIKLFNATVQTGNTEQTASNSTTATDTNSLIKTGQIKDVQWASNAVRDAVLPVLKGSTGKATWGGDKYEPANDTAQSAAEFIATHITDTAASPSKKAEDADSSYILASNQLGNRIAQALGKLKPSYSDIEPGKARSFVDGYYLLTTQTKSVMGSTAAQGTSPVFLVAGGDPVTITEKTNDVPTVDKKVRGDQTNATFTDDCIDSHVGQSIAYKITGTLPSNLKTYSTYRYIFHDQMPAGLSLIPDSVSVKVLGQNGTEAPINIEKSNITTSDTATDSNGSASNEEAVTGHELNVSIPDVKNLKNDEGKLVSVNENSRIVMSYEAAINTSAQYGTAGNVNTVKIEYSNNPNTTSTGFTQEDSARDYSYRLTIHKQDKNTNEALEGARFTIQVKDADDDASKGMYVQQDGSLSKSSYEFKTNAKGNIEVSGLDKGAYTLHETYAPTGYNPVPDSTVTLTPVYAGQELTQIKQDLTGGWDAFSGQLVFAGLGTEPGSDKLIAKDASGEKAPADKETGLIRITAEDVKTVDMPFTGQQGITLLVGAGIAITIVSAAAMRRRKTASNPES